jgi:cation diffusion facilitator family transporter
MAESRVAIYGAIAANVAIAATKFTVASISGSSAMLSEAIHSTVDTANDLLLLVGVHRSAQPATAQHPFGHGKELYFWSLIVAVLIFGAGGGVSFYEGVLHVMHPKPLEDAMWNYVVLAVAFLFEGISFGVAWRQFSRERQGKPFWHALHTSKDPSTYTVMAEDAAALLGLAMAALGVFASHALRMPRLDGVASMAIGVLLAAVAVLLIHESRGLLVGEGIARETAQGIREIATAEANVSQVGAILSMYVGARDVLVTFSAAFDPAAPARDVADTVARIETAVRERYPNIRRIYIEPVHPGEACR